MVSSEKKRVQIALDDSADAENRKEDKKRIAVGTSKAKRSKSFNGCFTCRSRKVKCDLKKPKCENCNKAGLICSGYDIKLKWSEPLCFFRRRGEIVSKSVIFSKSQEKEDNGLEFFQRRAINFVKWEAEYETYEDLDNDLSILHNSSNDEMVSTLNKTKLLGPFGVFNSKHYTKVSDNFDDKESSSDTLSSSQKWRGLDTKRQYYNGYHVQESYAPDHLWLSNELRDDAMLTAAALNGDSALLDLMSNLSSEGNGYQNTVQSSNFEIQNPNSNQNPNFLNLLFHKHNNLQAGGYSTKGNGNLDDKEETKNSGEGVISQKDGFLKLVGPSNQALYYSNYSNYYYDNPYKQNNNLEINLHASKHIKVSEEEANGFIDGENATNTQMPSSIMSIVNNPLEPEIGFQLSIPKIDHDGPQGMPTTALQVQPLTRYLLSYYNKIVADLMTVIPLTENPWRIIYFPKALMAIGELSALGKTSNAKNALLNALLAVSAFNLQAKFPKNSEPMKYYLNLGICLRNQASLFVRSLLGSNVDSEKDIERCVMSEKYKDVLCAVLSMISVDLVWGTMQDTNLYIRWCGRVIATKMKHKKKLSTRAKVLHRIFSSLKLIQDSTCLDIENIKLDIQSRTRDLEISGKGGPNGAVDLDQIFFSKVNDMFVDIETGEASVAGTEKGTPLFVDKKLINTNKNKENFATEALYGLPNSLIILFREIVNLLRINIYCGETGRALPVSYEKERQILEEKLNKWNLEWVLFKNNPIIVGNKVFLSPMHEITYHHIISFYHALTIYFERFINSVEPEKLQNKVAKTLEHLNAIQRIITQGTAFIIPLFWQGFIAGCEATSDELQTGFKKWGADIAQYLGSYWGARQIMLEVWRRKRVKDSRDDWISVISDWEMNLMLN